MSRRSTTKDLRISASLALPIDTVTGTHVIYGRKRKGKTYKGKVLAEEMLEQRQQIVVIDPTDAWWGLLSSADGTAPGYPITIFGGRHAHLPLEATAGEELADAIAEDDFSAIFSLKGMSRANEQRFCYSFLERLYRKNPQKPLHIFMDEADIYAPQNPFGEEARTLGATQNMVRRGGLDGLGMTLITQRPAVLSKSVSSQCDMLISVGLNDPRDLGAVEDWVKANFEDRDLARRLLVDIPTLGRPANKGIAWVLSADREIAERVMFRELRTFDSGRTPKVGEKRRVPRVLSQVDLEHLGKRIAATVEKAKETDPKHLRAKIVELEKHVAKAATAQPVAAGKPGKVIERFVIKDAQLARIESSIAAGDALIKRWDDRSSDAHEALSAVEEKARGHFANLSVQLAELGKAIASTRTPAPPIVAAAASAGMKVVSVREPVPSPRLKDVTITNTINPPANKPAPPEGTDGEPSGKAPRLMLATLAQHPAGLSRKQVLIFTGYRHSGTTTTAFAQILASGYASSEGGRLTITPSGLDWLGHYEPLPIGEDLRRHLLNGNNDLSAVEKIILTNACVSYPNPVDRETARGHYTHSGTTTTAFARLIAMNYVTKVRGGIVAAKELFD